MKKETVQVRAREKGGNGSTYLSTLSGNTTSQLFQTLEYTQCDENTWLTGTKGDFGWKVGE